MDAVANNERDRILDAFLALLAEREADRVSLADIADRAGVPLAVLAATFADKLAMFEAFTRRIDAAVLTLDASDMASELPRERMFDVLMSRIDAMRPYRRAVGSLMRSARRDAALAFALNAFAVRSHSWMLAQAGIDAAGWRGRLVAQGMAVMFARVLRVFVGEEDAGLPRTMAKLDRELREAERRYLRTARWMGPLVRDRFPSAPAPRDPPASAAMPGSAGGAVGSFAPTPTPPAGDPLTAAAMPGSASMAGPFPPPAQPAGASLTAASMPGSLDAAGPFPAPPASARDTFADGGPPVAAPEGPFAPVGPAGSPAAGDPFAAPASSGLAQDPDVAAAFTQAAVAHDPAPMPPAEVAGPRDEVGGEAGLAGDPAPASMGEAPPPSETSPADRAIENGSDAKPGP